MKFKEVKSLSTQDRNKKIEELKMELIKSQTGTAKTGNSKKRQIKKIIARIHTINKAENKSAELNNK